MTPEEAEAELNAAEQAQRLADAEAELATAEQQQRTTESTKAKPSQGMAALLGFGRGASFGALPALEGAMKTAQGAVLKAGMPLARPIAKAFVPGLADADVDAVARDAAREVLGIDLGEPLARTYATARDEKRGDMDAAAKAWPKTTLASTVAGGMAVPLPGSQALQGAGWATKAALRGAQGTAAGALNSFNESRANLVGPSQANADGSAPSLVGDTLKGGVIGGVAAPVLGAGLDALGSRAAQALQGMAQSNALRAITKGGIADKLRREGLETAEQRAQFGQDLLDTGIVQFGDDAAASLARAEEITQREAKTVADILKQADEVARTPFDFKAAADQARRNVTGQGLTTEAQAASGRAMDTIEKIAQMGAPQPPPLPGQTAVPRLPPTFQTAQTLKQEFYRRLYPDSASSLESSMDRQAVAGLRKSIEDQVAEALDPQAAARLVAANAKQGTSITASTLAADAASRNDAVLSPMQKALSSAAALSPILGFGTGLASGGAGAAAGGGALGTGASALLRLVIPRTPSMMASTQAKAAGVARALPQPAIQGARAAFSEEDERDAVDKFLSEGM